jgi:xylulokinase
MSLLGIDIGTKMIKTAIIDVDGNIVSHSSVDVYHLVQRPQVAWAQRDVNQLWGYIKKALSQLNGLDKVEAVCVDATSGTIVPINEKGNPLYPALMYSDERAIKEAEELKRRSKKAVEFEKFLPIAPYLVVPKIMWLKKNIDFKNVYKILHENDFVVFKLTNEVVTSPNIAGKAHADMRGNRYISEIYEDVDIDLNLMPTIKPIGDIISCVTEKASRETGIPVNTPVVNGITDASASDVATGTLTLGQANANIGTTLTLHAIVKEVVPDFACRFYYKAYIGDSYLAGGATNAGTLPIDALSTLLGITLSDLDKMAEKVPVGCNGLLAQPEWVGIRVPRSYPHVSGFFININEKNFTAGHLYRSLLEGNALVLNGLLTIIEDVTKTSIYEIRTCGGGAKSRTQNKIIADVAGKIVRKVKEGDAAIGSAIIAMYGTYKHIPVSEVVSKVVKVDAVYTPNPASREKYLKAGEKLKKITKFIGENLEQL